jgi:hypothetical protein
VTVSTLRPNGTTSNTGALTGGASAHVVLSAEVCQGRLMRPHVLGGDEKDVQGAVPTSQRGDGSSALVRPGRGSPVQSLKPPVTQGVQCTRQRGVVIRRAAGRDGLDAAPRRAGLVLAGLTRLVGRTFEHRQARVPARAALSLARRLPPPWRSALRRPRPGASPPSRSGGGSRLALPFASGSGGVLRSADAPGAHASTEGRHECSLRGSPGFLVRWLRSTPAPSERIYSAPGEWSRQRATPRV